MQLNLFSIGPASSKHDVADCAVYETQWRQIAPSIIAEIATSSHVCFVWATGPMEANELPYVFRYMAGHELPRYHIEGVTHLRRDSYRHSWFSYEYSNDTFQELMADTELDLEYTRLYLLWFEERWTEHLICKEFETIGLSWLLEHDAIALSFHRHFEGCYVLGLQSTINGVIERIRKIVSCMPPVQKPSCAKTQSEGVEHEND